MKIVISIFVLLVIPGFLLSQLEVKDKVPKQYSLEIGSRYVSSSTFENNATIGYTALFDYAWQLSGFTRKNASFISVPLGYTVLMPETDADERMSILSYGWTVRHEIGRDKKWIPFVGYALLFNQLRISGTEGTVFGHQTKFDLGLNLNTKSKVDYFAKVEYSFTRYPSLGQAKSDRMHAFEFKLGLRF